MWLSKQFLPLVAVIPVLLAVPVRAQDAPPPEAFAELVRQLDADEFTARESASEKLATAGKAAIPALAKAATGDNLEASTRSMRILQKLLSSPDGETKAAARATLEKIAKTNHPSASRRAQEAIAPPPDPPKPQPQPGIHFGQIIIATRIGMKNVNGVKEISVDENGRKVEIRDDPQKGIRVAITENQNGQPVTRVVEAKNADELKKKDPQAHKLYQQYGQGNAIGGGVIQLQIRGVGGIQAIPFQPRIRGAMPQRIQIMPARAPIGPAKRIEMATRQLQAIGRQLARTAKDAEKTDAEKTEELQKALKQFRQELQKQLVEVDKQLKPPAEQPEKAR